MKEILMNLDLPDIYEHGLFVYTPTLDGIPDYIDLIPKGYTFEKCKKLFKLVSIESMKFHLNEAIKENAISDSEIQEAHKLIEEAINEYNGM
ncbi:hypothetical protein [Schinkia azotoformans]|uniref:hypothetical protein n=2 Tax=Schinkia azotoformans TaxID=1454 RepID=UPI002DB75D17|nr:hypothetical protein [Schinkia azotoformans]MEC1716617.1 hypothetical protein [Schinkia azotoformans]MEC1739455.1 hypothetical protein [Schinkia azotoformans]MEC1745475.1 hypothetical protein [Schinkia azotoformans]MEC1756538.1 hypothetical protein [Schinkia azotoformans]MEC1765805.1 hypothetical protein [Schinkia azotoformans]